jgi:hypothetical protein
MITEGAVEILFPRCSKGHGSSNENFVRAGIVFSIVVLVMLDPQQEADKIADVLFTNTGDTTKSHKDRVVKERER